MVADPSGITFVSGLMIAIIGMFRTIRPRKSSRKLAGLFQFGESWTRLNQAA
jgi:hypothetical protein